MLDNCISQPIEGFYIPYGLQDRFTELVGIRWRTDDPQPIYNKQWVYQETWRKKDCIARNIDGSIKYDNDNMPKMVTKNILACHQADTFKKFIDQHREIITAEKKEMIKNDDQYYIWFKELLNQFSREAFN